MKSKTMNVYQTPVIIKIKIDNSISLVLNSTTEELNPIWGPGESIEQF